MSRGLKIQIEIEEELHYPCGENKALISFAVTAKLICVFVFAYAKKHGFLTTRLIFGDRLGTNQARSAAKIFGSSYTIVLNCFSIISGDSSRYLSGAVDSCVTYYLNILYTLSGTFSKVTAINLTIIYENIFYMDLKIGYQITNFTKV